LHLQQGGCGQGRQRQGQQRHLQQQLFAGMRQLPRPFSVLNPQQTPLPKPLTMLPIPQAMSLSPLSQQGRHSL